MNQNPTLIFWCIIFTTYVFTPGCCPPQQIPTTQENSDYCQGLLTLCRTQCPEIPPNPCHRNCQDDFDRCLKMETKTP